MLYFTSFLQRLLTPGAGTLGTAPNLIYAQLVDTNVDALTAADSTLADVAANARVGNPVQLTGVTITNGVLDANDVLFTGVGTALTLPDARGLLLYTGASGAPDASMSLMVLFQAADIPGLPAIDLNNSTISIVWNASGVLRIVGAA